MRLNGVYYFRQRVPLDLIPTVGKRWIKESLRTKNATLAKALHAQVAAKYAARWEELRKNPIHHLDSRDSAALAGEIYRQILEREGEKPRHAWSRREWFMRRAGLMFGLDHFSPSALIAEDSNVAEVEIPRVAMEKTPTMPEVEAAAVTDNAVSEDAASADPRRRLNEEFCGADYVAKEIGRDLDALLKRAGIVLGPEKREDVLFQAGEAAIRAYEKLMKESHGDFSADANANRFPPFVAWADAVRHSSLAEDVWRGGEPHWARATQRKYRHALDDFLEQFPSYALHRTRGDWDLAKVTTDHVRAWRDNLLTRLAGKTSARTIQREYLGSLKSIFAYAVRNGRLRENPAKGIYVEEAWGKKAAKMRGFFDEEAKAILRASLATPPARMSKHQADARRWAPWLCAYTGARVNEITQLRGQDVVERDGYWCVSITPEAGSQKQGMARLVPLHDHLIEQGFVAFAQKFRPAQPLFHAFEIPESVKTDKEKNDHRRRAAAAAATTSGRLATWVRSLKEVAAGDVHPNHGWRHRFKTEGLFRGMIPVVLDAIQGHAPATISEKYGDKPPRVTAPEIAKLPRIELT